MGVKLMRAKVLQMVVHCSDIHKTADLAYLHSFSLVDLKSVVHTRNEEYLTDFDETDK